MLLSASSGMFGLSWILVVVLGMVSCTGSSNDNTLDEERVQLKNKLLSQLDQLETRSEEGLEKREMSQCVQREYELYQCKVRELENTMRNSKAKAGPAIAFSVALSKDYAVVGNVKYDALTLNEGRHYDPASGVFTAPIQGTYSFHVSTWASVYVRLIMTKNGKAVVGCDGQGKSMSNNAILHLERGDRVSIYMVQGTMVGAQTDRLGFVNIYYSTFSGHII